MIARHTPATTIKKFELKRLGKLETRNKTKGKMKNNHNVYKQSEKTE
jgi:hypothetical protein